MAEAGRRVIVTGAAGGIGSALVAAFHAAGWRVIATDMAPRPDGLACDTWLQADLGRTVDDEAYAAGVFGQLRAALAGAPLHALVNNAAVQVLGGLDELDRDAWHRSLDVNLLAPFLWTQALRAELQAVRGAVINISSIHARLTKRGFVAYATSKAALSGMTRALAVDAGDRLRVNAIEPAAIATPMLRAGFVGKDALYARLEGCHPAGRIGQPDEVAQLALALADGRLGFANGACVALDGGIGGRLHDPD